MVDLSAPALEVAPALLGCLVTQGDVVVRMTEVEAYAGWDDPAAHAFGGPRPHTRDLFGAPGTLYCYRSYGIHVCGNLVCGPAGSGSAVLLRSGAVVAGIDRARLRRPGVEDAALARGPGNLGRVMGWSVADSGGRVGEAGLELADPVGPVGVVRQGPRVGVSVARVRPWRFWLADEPTVSRYRSSPRVRPPAW
ncbi:MAG: DNA-3-methyladenine glycosylase [Propionicimonas sp.]